MKYEPSKKKINENIKINNVWRKFRKKKKKTDTNVILPSYFVVLHDIKLS